MDPAPQEALSVATPDQIAVVEQKIRLIKQRKLRKAREVGLCTKLKSVS